MSCLPAFASDEIIVPHKYIVTVEVCPADRIVEALLSRFFEKLCLELSCDCAGHVAALETRVHTLSKHKQLTTRTSWNFTSHTDSHTDS
jgi:hypothetical protein